MVNKKKIYFVCMIFTFSFILSACNVLQSGRYIRDDRKIADEQIAKILDSIEKKDKEGLKQLFSSQTLKTANDIDGGIDYVMNFYKGSMTSMEPGAVETRESSDYGKKKIELECAYNIITDMGTYRIIFLYVTKDSNYPENVGLYRLGIITENDRQNLISNGYYTTIGIYQP